MATSVELVLLKCIQCETPVPAEEDEVAWVCATCGRGLQLSEAGLAPLEVHWSATRPGQRVEKWRPVWVFTGTARFLRRESYSGRGQPHRLWQQPVRLFVPAYACSLEELERVGADLTQQQPRWEAGSPAGPLRGCTLLPEEARAAAEFVVLTIEADQKDKLKTVEFVLEVGEPELWVVEGNW
jgi:hypothetical protein